MEIRSAHFDLFTEGAEAPGRELVHYFEQVRSFFQQAFGLNGRGRVVRIVCFRSARQFQYYEASKIADAAFHPGSRHDYILMKNDEAGRYPVAVHEYTHLILRATNHDIPVWLDEGLAEVYSNLEPHGSFVLVGRTIPARLDALAAGRWINLRTLVSASRASAVYTKQPDAEMFYAESWALVHMLALDNAYSPRLRPLMDALLARRQRRGISEDLRQAHRAGGGRPARLPGQQPPQRCGLSGPPAAVRPSPHGDP